MNYELCINDNVKDFIKKHLKDDVNKLALSKFPEGIDREFVIRQIHARQVLDKKLPSWAENDELIFPKKLSLEQCSSELTAKYKTTLLSTKPHETTRKEFSANSCNLVDEDLVEEKLSTKPHEIIRKEFSANSCDLVDEDLVEEKLSTKPHETTRKEFSANSCNLVDEEKSTKPHETSRKGFSADSCNLVDEDLVDEEKSTKPHETPRKEFSADSCNLADEHLVDEEKSTKPHEMTRKGFSADSCNLVDEDLVYEKRILVDLTGGMGVDTAFLSDDFDKAYYVEMQEELCEIAKHNFKILNKNIEVVNDNAEHFLTICDKVDCIYLDPARRDEYGRKMVSLHDCSPDVAELQDVLLEKAKTIIVKLSPMLDIDIVKKELKNIKKIDVVAVRNECKELVVVLGQQTTDNGQQTLPMSHGSQLKAIDLRENWNFNFTEDEEQNAEWTLADTVGKYLYEPGVACMKAGCFKLLSQRYGLDKLHRNSHLYTSDELVSDFPGRIFEVVNVVPFHKKTKKEISSICQQTTDNRQQTDSKLTAQNSKLKASVTVRNFPLSAEELKKNLGLQDGSEFYIFGTTMKGEKKVVVLTKKL